MTMHYVTGTDFVQAHLDVVREDIRRSRVGRGNGRGSPSTGIRSQIAKLLVLAGARLMGDGPALVGSRVIVLEPPKADERCGEEALVPAA